jgi:hypothetical protein
MRLCSISFTRNSFCLNFDKEGSKVTENIRLSTDADLCLSETELFNPFSEYDIINPAHLQDIYSVLNSKVLDFRALNKHRACRMDFENLTLFTWTGKKDLPDCLYMATKNPSSEHSQWWLIDDQ